MAKESTEEDKSETTTEEVDEETQDEPEVAEGEDKESEEEETESTEESEDEPTFKKRFTQFKGESPEEYLKNLEDGYAESSKEAVRLSRELKQKAAPEADSPQAPAAEGQPATQDPAVLWVQSEMQRTWEKDYKEFAEDHPDIETDPKLAEDLDNQLKVVRDVILQSEGRLVGMSEGLNKAWKLLGKDDSNERVRSAAKDSASQGRTAGGTQTEPRTKFTESQIKFYMDSKDMSRNEAIKELSEYNK